MLECFIPISIGYCIVWGFLINLVVLTEAIKENERLYAEESKINPKRH